MAASKLKCVLGVLGVAGLAIGLSGCGGDPDAVYKQATGYECSHHEGWFSNKACTNRPPGQNQEEVSRYCYATIGVANCFDRPDQDRKNQALGSSGY